MKTEVLLEAFAKLGRVDVEAGDDGAYSIGDKKVRVETTTHKYVVHIGGEGVRISMPRIATPSALARTILTTMGVTRRPDAGKVPWAITAGRSLFVVRGYGEVPKGGRRQVMVLAASAGTAKSLGAKLVGKESTALEATEAEQGRHETVLCEDGKERPIAVVFQALAPLR